MMSFSMRILALSIVLIGRSNAAEAPPPPDLPPTAVVRKALTNQAAVLAALSGVRAGEAQRTRLASGPHETLLGAGTQRRRAADGRYGEWELTLERTLRLPGKAALDARVGDEIVSAARLAVGEALHQSARLLLASWLALLRESQIARHWAEQTDIHAAQQAVVERRVTLGDAPRMELNLAQAAAEQARAQAALADGRVAAARRSLELQFPGISPPVLPELRSPETLDGDLSLWRDRVLEHSHELVMARTLVEQRKLITARTDAERSPDPTFGLRYGSERDGAEHVAGVYFSIPLAGEARRADVVRATAELEAAAQQEAAILRRLEIEVAAGWEAARSTRLAWQQAKSAAERMAQHAATLQRSYALGESSLADVLGARRLATEAALAAISARADAVEQRYRLMLDAHLVWPGLNVGFDRR